MALCRRGRSFDLVEADTHTVAEVVMQLRAWLGLPPAPMLRLPDALARPVARIADGLTWLGWRSPLRTTAMREIKHGVLGDSTAWQATTGTRLLTLRETLQQMPATVQEHWFAMAVSAQTHAGADARGILVCHRRDRHRESAAGTHCSLLPVSKASQRKPWCSVEPLSMRCWVWWCCIGAVCVPPRLQWWR